MTAASIRQSLRELFGSRLVSTLELSLLQLRQDYDARIRYQDDIISTLRGEKAELSAKILTYENTIMPLSSRAGADLVKAARPTYPKFPSFDFSQSPPMMSKWDYAQQEHNKQMEAEIEAEKSQAASAPQGSA